MFNDKNMIILNLLPKEEKTIYKQERSYLIIKNSLLLLMIAVALITTILASAKFILEKNFSSLVGDVSSPSNLNVEMRKKITNINAKLQKISEIQKEYFNFSEPLVHLSGLLPENVQIFSLNLDAASREFFIKGKAKTRESLLNFQKKLEDSPIFKEIQFPLTNLLYKENVIFEFSGKLTL